MISISLRVEEADIQRYGRVDAFCRALTEWEHFDWVKYLREHGTIEKIDTYKDVSSKSYTYVHTYKVTWKLSEKDEFFFRLKYSEQLNEAKQYV